MKPFAVVCCRWAGVRAAHVLYDQGRAESVGYPQNNAMPTPDPRNTVNPVDIWWADSEADAKGIMMGLSEVNPGNSFVMLKSQEMMQSVVETTTTHRSQFTSKGLLPV